MTARAKVFIIRQEYTNTMRAPLNCQDEPYEVRIAGDTYRNATGHPITLLYEDGSVRCRLSAAPMDPIRVDLCKTRVNEILSKSVATGVTGLPPETPGVYLVVSALVKLNVPSRDDLVVPTLVTKVNGRVIGCGGFLM